MIGGLMSNDFDRIWKDAATVIFNILFLQLPGMAEENHESLSQGSHFLG
jgi:hypothetical protein